MKAELETREPTLASEARPSRIVFFDGDCAFCNRSVQFLCRHDTHSLLFYAPLLGSTAADLLPAFGIEPERLDSIIYYRNGCVYDKSRAALAIARDLGGLWRLSLFLYIIPGAIRDWVYDLLARHRHRLVTENPSCFVPSSELKRRLLA